MTLDTTQPIDTNSRTITNSAHFKVEVYSSTAGTSYDYVCLSTPGATLTDSEWQVIRVDGSGNLDHADGNEYFDNVATSLAVVQALSFS